MLKGKNWLQWSVLVVSGIFMLFAGGCGGGGGGDTPVVTPPPPPPKPEPQGNWQDEGNYDTGWYAVKPYEISTAQELAGLAKLVNDGNTFEGEIISIVGDIDLQDHYWTSIGNYEHFFRGTLDGQKKVISNITVIVQPPSEWGGAFTGFVGRNHGILKDINLTEISISGVNDGLVYVGGITGFNYGEIISCNVSGTISVTGQGTAAGGLVGRNEEKGKITDCRANVNVSATSAVPDLSSSAGGFAGLNSNGATITNCVVSGGTVTARHTQGGLVAKGSFLGVQTEHNNTLSGNRADGSPKIGRDARKSPPDPSDDI